MTNPPHSNNPAPGAASSVATSSSGLAPNVAGALAYLLGVITGVIFFVIEKEDRFVRFHAAQSIAVTIVLTVVGIGLSILSTALVFVPILGWIVAFLLSVGLMLVTFVLWVLLMWRAFQGREWEVPIAGGIARKMMG